MSSSGRDDLISLSSCTCWSHSDPYVWGLTLSVDFGISLRLLDCTCWSHSDLYVWGVTPSWV